MNARLENRSRSSLASGGVRLASENIEAAIFQADVMRSLPHELVEKLVPSFTYLCAAKGETIVR